MILKSKKLKLNLDYPIVMGILNLTDDSFSDGGLYNTLDKALFHVEKMIKNGAKIIDIGGQSTRPGSKLISSQEEIDRVITILESIIKKFNIWTSIDTFKPKVMEEACKIGVNMINDIYSLRNEKSLRIAVKNAIPICIMHMKGYPCKLYNNINYKNIIKEIIYFFKIQIKRLLKSGILKKNIIIDPGFGFSKNILHNYAILNFLNKFKYFKLPILIGISRKSMIRRLLNVDINDSILPSVNCAVIAAIKGANIIRAHDVRETVNAMKIIKIMLLTNNYEYK